MKADIIGIIALLELKGIGPAFINKVTKANSFIEADLVNIITSITKAANKHFENDIIIQAIENAHSIIQKCDAADIQIIAIADPRYPSLLTQIKDPPPILYCRGNIELLKSVMVCIIGTREPSESAIIISERVGLYFSNANFTICNGLAEGVDNYAIKSQGVIHSKVIGVVAGGLNFDKKKTLLKTTAENANLVLQKEGLLISEVPPDKKEDTFSVIKSCRIQAGVSTGVILVQSALNGGSRFTIRTFSEVDRPIAIVNPFKTDGELDSYSANCELIHNSIEGLAKFADMKLNKVKTSVIYIIKSKDDYLDFANKMKKQEGHIDKAKATLFSQ